MSRLLHAEGGLFGQLKWDPFSLGKRSIRYGLMSYLRLTHFLRIQEHCSVDNADFYGLVYNQRFYYQNMWTTRET